MEHSATRRKILTERTTPVEVFSIQYSASLPSRSRVKPKRETQLNSGGLQGKAFGYQKVALESTLRPHNDGAARRVSETIESCFHAQSKFLWADLLACPSRAQDASGPRDNRVGRKELRNSLVERGLVGREY
jgi:hypothetical protein